MSRKSPIIVVRAKWRGIATITAVPIYPCQEVGLGFVILKSNQARTYKIWSLGTEPVIIPPSPEESVKCYLHVFNQV